MMGKWALALVLHENGTSALPTGKMDIKEANMCLLFSQSEVPKGFSHLVENRLSY